jgi:hypothetical protein
MSSRDINRVVTAAYIMVHRGYSVDYVVCDDDLNAHFISEARKLLPTAGVLDLNSGLLNARKAGGFPRCSKRTRFDHSDYSFAAEIAARHLERSDGATLDQVICDPRLRAVFDRVASSLVGGVPPIRLRLAALALRKARSLRPEPFGRFSTPHLRLIDAETAKATPLRIPDACGAYVILSRRENVVLYVGEARSLRTRLLTHLEHSDRPELARYFWTHGIDDIVIEIHDLSNDPRATQTSYRRAYEAELIQSRQPRFNIQMRSTNGPEVS